MTSVTNTFPQNRSVITIQHPETDSEKIAERKEPVNWDQELQWLQENRWILEEYEGEWVAIKGSKLIAHRDDYQTLRTFCQDHAIHDPLIQYIPNSLHEWDIGISNHIVSADCNTP